MAVVIRKQDPPPDEREDEFVAAIRDAQAEIAASVEKAGLRNDALRYPLGAISTALGTFPELVARLDAVAERVQPASPPPGKDVVDAIDRAVSSIALAIGADVRRRTWITFAAALVVVGFGGIAGGYLAGYRQGEAAAISTVTDLRAALAEGVPGATTWRNLIDWNGAGIEESMKQCRPADPVGGRAACFVPLWTAPVVPNGKIGK